MFPSADALESTEALKLCGRNRLCLFDFLASGGDGTLAQQAMQNGQIYQTIIQNTQPGIEKKPYIFVKLFDKARTYLSVR